jgi:NADPH:quinone reductase-like Zn-dependent oxidoreductase
VSHVAQNPTDWKHVHFAFAKPGSIVGCDFAGEVVEVGKDVTGKHFDFYQSAKVMHSFVFFRLFKK